ncbi:MAG: PQQ-dependent sugar dehydrogenase [Acidobacteriota bacterium]
MGDHYSAGASSCEASDCRQVEIYNFDEDVAVTAMVNLDSLQVLDVFSLPGMHPGINSRLAAVAEEIAFSDSAVVEALGYVPTQSTMGPTDAGLTDSACQQGHLCVGFTFALGDRILWAIVDLTEERMAGLNWTEMRESDRPVPAFVPEGCLPPGGVDRDGWSLRYEVTGTDGLRVYDVTYQGLPVLTSVKLLEWHVDYGLSGFEDVTGCGGAGGGFQIGPFGGTQVLDLEDGQGNVIGFEVVQDFRMSAWGDFCNYRYEQHIQFFQDGRFRVAAAAFGKGCGTNAVYRPVVRIDIAAGGDENDTFALWEDGSWQQQTVEGWWSQADPYTPRGYKWRIRDGSGIGYFVQPGLEGTFGDRGRGDDAFIYVTQHKPEEGDIDLGVIGDCCRDDFRQGPQKYINGESIENENIVVWYVPQSVTDADGNKAPGYYCWTVSGEPDPETYPCFAGPMFVPFGLSDAPRVSALPGSLEATAAAGSSVATQLTLSNTGGAELRWILAEATNGGGPVSPSLDLVPIAGGFDEPLDIDSVGDGRLFITEKDGTIRVILADGSVRLVPFLNIRSRVGSADSEQGLLGLAFHPNYLQNGFFFVNYTNNSGDTVVSRFSLANQPNLADADSEVVLMTVDQPFSNHNGGNLVFGPDGFLYIGFGDGGSGGDPGDRAQNPQELLGKLLRIDVDGGTPYGIPADNPFVDDPTTLDEIWALGVRNPWRYSFDRITGDLLIGDVGQNRWEEIDFQPAASPGGDNWGWRCYEGNHEFETTNCGPLASYDFPIFEYDHGFGCSVSGGYVYRGTQFPALVGNYILNDYCTGNFWTLLQDDLGVWQATFHPGLGGFGFVAYGEGSEGELYAANIADGFIYQVQETSPARLTWLDITPKQATTPAGVARTVDIRFDAAGLSPATYTGYLVIHSNDPLNPQIQIPVTFTVSAPSAASEGVVLRIR